MNQIRYGSALQPAAINVGDLLINCDLAPHVPTGWTIAEHQRGGTFRWDPSRFALFRDQEQVGGMLGLRVLRDRLRTRSVLNANMLDFFLKNKHVIPLECKGKYVFFWGTTYYDSDGHEIVRCLSFDGFDWQDLPIWLVYESDEQEYAAIRIP